MLDYNIWRNVLQGGVRAVPTRIGPGAKHHISEDTRLWTNTLSILPVCQASEEIWIAHKEREGMTEEIQDWTRMREEMG